MLNWMSLTTVKESSCLTQDDRAEVWIIIPIKACTWIEHFTDEKFWKIIPDGSEKLIPNLKKLSFVQTWNI